MTDEILRTEGLCKSFGKLQVLKGIDTTIRQGEVVSIIGANGAGKSSLMNAISGIVKYKNGEIVYKK